MVYFCSYVQGMKYSVSSTFLRYLRLSKHFKLVLAPTLNIPHYMVRGVLIDTQREAFCLVRYIV